MLSAVRALGHDPAADDGPLLVGLSGGPDSLALAAAAAHWARRGELRVGAVVVDHGLQPGSDRVAARAAEQARDLGLDPVEIRPVEVRDRGEGPEAAARAARFAALHAAAAEHGARAVLLGHTLDDQAESVLLGLARGSGTRSLSGMPRQRSQGPVPVLRPLLGLRRRQTEAVCAAEQLEPWHDPANADESMLRARVRRTVLPELERQLGPGVAEALARTAEILGPDAELLEQQSRSVLERALAAAPGPDPGEGAPADPVLVLSLEVLQSEPAPLVRRALARACTDLGAERPTFERLSALAELARGRGEAGPVQMAGKVAAYRRRPRRGGRGAGTLELILQR
ncbi:tRNA lysidine(34) synthetase TilS [Kocuria palustris]|uniref:tRNA lysidine(34) synthetase TilS n=1 Tax=Kocuria palustris TaxID=71999 RepID=UPI0021B1B9F2|nr:tRNA lysidine(34) synthetase TilS [Kocuria palustris]